MVILQMCKQTNTAVIVNFSLIVECIQFIFLLSSSLQKETMLLFLLFFGIGSSSASGAHWDYNSRVVTIIIKIVSLLIVIFS